MLPKLNPIIFTKYTSIMQAIKTRLLFRL